MKKARKTSTQVWLFIIFSSLLFLILCSQWGGRSGLITGLLVALLFHGLIFLWGEGLLLSLFQLTPLRGRDPWRLNHKLKSWCEEHGLDLPQLYVLETDLPTAFAFEVPWKQPLIALSRGLLKNTTSREVEIVLAHQLCQLEHRRSLRFAVLSLLASTLARLAVVLDKAWIPNSVFGKKNQKPFLILFSPLISGLVRFSFSANDQFASDQNAAQLIGSRDQLGKVLWKLDGWSLTHPMEVPPATSQLFIVNPERIRQKNSLLQFHPSMKTRLEKLVGSFPI